MNEPIWVPTSYPAPESPFESRPLTSITKLVIHHTAGPLDQSPLEIDAEERAGGDYIYVPYTWFVDYKGNKYVARPPGVVSAATFGWNKESVAICAIGNYERSVAGFTGLPTDALLEAIIQVSVYAHQLCPNIDNTWDHNEAGGTQNENAKFKTYSDDAVRAATAYVLRFRKSRRLHGQEYTQRPPMADSRVVRGGGRFHGWPVLLRPLLAAFVTLCFCIVCLVDVGWLLVGMVIWGTIGRGPNPGK